jgi:signal transduction histidine kinase
MKPMPIRALIIEDNPGDARLILEMFKGAEIPHDLTTASSLQEGIGHCKHNSFHVILLDLSLPDSHGLETLTQLSKHVSDVPIVVLTGFNDERLGAEAVAAGAQDYLIKGEINASILLRSILYARERHNVEVADRELATLQERQRLARELHDSVTQSLFTANVMAESSLIQWEQNPEKAHGLVQQVHRLTKGALAEMRVLLLELRPESLLDAPLHILIQQLIESVYSRKDIAFETALDEIPPLDDETQLTFYRITQEALNNIFKHAQPVIRKSDAATQSK